MINIKHSFTTLLVLVTFTLTACGEDKLMTYEYYKENPEERQNILEKCEAEAEKGYEPEGNFGENCETAYQVQRNHAMNSMRRAIANFN